MESLRLTAFNTLFLLLCLQCGSCAGATIVMKNSLDLANSGLSLSSNYGGRDTSLPIVERYNRQADQNSPVLDFILRRFQGVLNKIQSFRNTLNLDNNGVSVSGVHGPQSRFTESFSGASSADFMKMADTKTPKSATPTSAPVKRVPLSTSAAPVSIPASAAPIFGNSANVTSGEDLSLGTSDFEEISELQNQDENLAERRRFQRQNVLNSDDSDLAPAFSDDDDDQENLSVPSLVTSTSTTPRPPTTNSVTSTATSKSLTDVAKDTLQIKTQQELQKVQNAVKEPEGNVMVRDFDPDLDDTRDFAPFPSFDDDTDKGDGGFDFNPEVEIPALKQFKSSSAPASTPAPRITTEASSSLMTPSTNSSNVEQRQNADDDDLPPSFGDGFEQEPEDEDINSAFSSTAYPVISSTAKTSAASITKEFPAALEPIRSPTSAKPIPNESNIPPNPTSDDDIEELIDYDSDSKSGNFVAQGISGSVQSDEGAGIIKYSDNILATLLKSIRSTTAAPDSPSNVNSPPHPPTESDKKPLVSAPASFSGANNIKTPSNLVRQNFQTSDLLTDISATGNADNLSQFIRDRLLQNIYSAIQATTGALFRNAAAGHAPASFIYIGPININTGSNGQVNYGTLGVGESSRNLRPFSSNGENAGPTPLSSVADTVQAQQLKNHQLGIRAMKAEQDNYDANFPERNFSPGSTHSKTAIFQKPSALTSTNGFSSNGEGPPLPLLPDPELQDFPPSPVLTASRGFKATEETQQARKSTKPTAEPAPDSRHDQGPPAPVTFDYDDAELFDTRILRLSSKRPKK